MYKRIDSRFEKMIENGFTEEVKSLLRKGFDPQASALRTIGYKEIVEYLNGNLKFEEAVEKAKMRTRNFAKRQLTWFKKIPGIHWYSSEEPAIINHIIDPWRRATLN